MKTKTVVQPQQKSLSKAPLSQAPLFTNTGESSGPQSAIQRARKQPSGVLAYAAIQTPFSAAIQRSAAVLADRDSEDLHQMRVSLRKLRTAVSVFEPVLQLPKMLSDRQIADIASTLGEVRDLDVLRQWFQTYETQSQPTPKETKLLKKLYKHLNKRRRKAMGTVEKLFQSKRYGQFIAQAEQWLKRPQYRAASQLSMAILLPDLLLPNISQFLLHPGWFVAIIIEEDKVQPIMDMSSAALPKVLQQRGKDLHRLRKQTKRLRYQIELLQSCLSESNGDRIPELKTIQTVLGYFQDKVVLNQVLRRELGDRWPKKLPDLERYIQQQDQAHWQQWQSLQYQYLEVNFRREFRQWVLT